MKKDLPARSKLVLPNGGDRVLLHSCCAPCAVDIIETIVDSGITPTIYFYNPNIQPRAEYEIRKKESKIFAEKKQLPFIDADYDLEKWHACTAGLEHEPERGRRCDACFDLRLFQAASYAATHDFPVFATTLGISRWKDQAQVYRAGRAAAARAAVLFWDYNFRKDGGAGRTIARGKEEDFYRQEYCGCAPSLRDANRSREARGLPPLRLHADDEPA